MEDLSNQGTGMLANRAGAGASKPMGSNPTPAKPSTGFGTAKPVANISGQPAKPMTGANNQDFGQILAEPDDNKAADAVLNHLSTNNINFEDPAFGDTPEGLEIGKRIQQNPKFADALNSAQERLIQQASQNTQQAFNGQG